MLAQQVIREAMEAAAKQLHVLEGGDKVEREGAAFGDAGNDTEIKADRVLGEIIRDVILKSGDAARVTIEGLGEFTGTGKNWYTVDPLDGSLDYKVRVPYWGGLPYTACITMLRAGERFTFDAIDVVAIADLRLAQAPTYVMATRVQPQREFEAKTQFEAFCEPGHHQLRSRQETKLDLGSQIVIGEMYYPENRELLARMFAGKKGWLRSPGSAAYEMSLVATGQAVAMICDRQKQHELGAGYLLVKGAGGVAVDFDGKDLGGREYDFETQLPMVLAANQDIADQILELMRKSR
jgi:fructose-1,6-bisphosphatase/inositol monophosphatase family enzyme